MNDFESQRAEKAARFRELAAKHENISTGRHLAARQRIEMIPLSDHWLCPWVRKNPRNLACCFPPQKLEFLRRQGASNSSWEVKILRKYFTCRSDVALPQKYAGMPHPIRSRCEARRPFQP